MIIYILHRLAINSFRFPFRSAFLLHTPNFNLSLEKACIKVTRCAAGHAGHVDHDFDSILKKKILIIPCGLQPTAADYYRLIVVACLRSLRLDILLLLTVTASN